MVEAEIRENRHEGMKERMKCVLQLCFSKSDLKLLSECILSFL